MDQRWQRHGRLWVFGPSGRPAASGSDGDFNFGGPGIRAAAGGVRLPNERQCLEPWILWQQPSQAYFGWIGRRSTRADPPCAVSGIADGLGCTDPAYLEYDAAANTDDGSCATLSSRLHGPATEYDASANTDDGSARRSLGCTDAYTDTRCLTRQLRTLLGCTDWLPRIRRARS